jgi:hypothetical protein
MTSRLLCLIGALTWWAVVSPVMAVGIDVTYSGTLAAGNATGFIVSPLSGSLAGDSVKIDLTFDTSSFNSVYTNVPSFSSLVSSGGGGASVGVSVSFYSSAGAILQEIESSNLGGSATDASQRGGSQQFLSGSSNFAGVTTQNLFTMSVANRAIPASITQSVDLKNIPLSVYFLMSESGPFGFSVSGNLDFGNFQVTSPIPSATPLPAAFPLFAAGLGVLGLLGLRKKRRSAVSRPLTN